MLTVNLPTNFPPRLFCGVQFCGIPSHRSDSHLVQVRFGGDAEPTFYVDGARWTT